jgi:hypothetical protein
MIYDGGSSTSVLSGTSTGIAFNGNGNAYGTVQSFSGSNSTKTRLAQRFAPPEAIYVSKVWSRIGYHAISGIVFGFAFWIINFKLPDTMGGADTLGFVALACLPIIIYHLIKICILFYQLKEAANKDEDVERLYGIWLKTCACLTCGNIFTL